MAGGVKGGGWVQHTMIAGALAASGTEASSGVGKEDRVNKSL